MRSRLRQCGTPVNLVQLEAREILLLFYRLYFIALIECSNAILPAQWNGNLSVASYKVRLNLIQMCPLLVFLSPARLRGGSSSNVLLDRPPNILSRMEQNLDETQLFTPLREQVLL